MNIYGLTLALLLLPAGAAAEVKPLPPTRWPNTVAEAVPHILTALTPTQKSIISGTSKENLVLFSGEWGEDIEILLGLNSGNALLLHASCAGPCNVEQATLTLMQAAWDALQQ